MIAASVIGSPETTLTPPRIGVILTAAGSSTRFGGDKLSARFGDQSVLARSIAAFVDVPNVCEIVVALSPDLDDASELGLEIARLNETHAHANVRFVRVGGTSRAQTVANAARELRADCDWLAVHDAARPLVSRALIDRVITAALESGAAAPAMAVTSTIKQGGATLPTRVERTVPRSTLWAMQTPQMMRRAALLDAVVRCPIPLGEVTDDVQLLELAGQAVLLVEGDERNLKITTRLDLELARLLLTPSTKAAEKF